jgi:hypothetical protein
VFIFVSSSKCVPRNAVGDEAGVQLLFESSRFTFCFLAVGGAWGSLSFLSRQRVRPLQLQLRAVGMLLYGNADVMVHFG